MSKGLERVSVLQTTKVRTKLKGDGSWVQRQSEAEAEKQEDKPWMAEVKAGRLNGAPLETSPVSSPTTLSPAQPDPTRTPTSGYLIRGVFTKTDTKPSIPNYSGSTSSYTRKPSETYKKIAPHTVRPTSDLKANTEDNLSSEEKMKREEAARNVLKTAPVRRSYVLSAAKKYDSTETPPETLPTPDIPCFVAQRVVITDDDDFAKTSSPPGVSSQPSLINDITPMKKVPAPVQTDSAAVKLNSYPVKNPYVPVKIDAAPVKTNLAQVNMDPAQTHLSHLILVHPGPTSTLINPLPQ
ncbi:hypothetical protein DPEC_G00021570 [Dallia pectoralis]|uniref:Uncharacterized protein n=1 Tax=Dallia pectoralis TaxID=75939 RepID=A0ACC2HGW1_DALPE|nr:hypothetical protein DPEC_G00021570 [Dallia pectoralis]